MLCGSAFTRRVICPARWYCRPDNSITTGGGHDAKAYPLGRGDIPLTVGRARRRAGAARSHRGSADHRHRRSAALRGRSVLAEAAAEPLGARQRHRRLGRLHRHRLDRPPRLGDARRQREGAGAEAGRLLRRRAADARLRQAGQPGPATGAVPAPGYDWPSRTTASSSITPAWSGSAATAPATRRS